MGLSDLPREILDLIIDQTIPSGIESFALTCKTIYERARSSIERHNALKRRWKHTTNAYTGRLCDTLRILYDIAHEPLIAEYIEYLNLWDRRHPDETEYQTAAVSFRNDSFAMSRIKDTVYHTDFLPHARRVELWQQIVGEDKQGEGYGLDNLFADVALLALLPNLKGLHPPDQWHELRHGETSEALVPVVESLVGLSDESTSRQKPLSSLETIFPFVEEGYDYRASLQCVQPFMCLESIRSIYAVSLVAIDDDYEDMLFTWSNPTLISPLVRIEFASCCMDAGALSVLLRNTPTLTIFRYSHQTKWDGLQYDWNAGEFMETLANYCGARLTDLALTIDELHGELINGASSFLRFTSLERLEVDVSVFCGPPVESGQRLGRDARIPEGSQPWTHVDIPCMGDMLPASMLELQVNTDHPEPSEQALYSLFKNIKDRRQDKLLKLEKVVIRQYQSRSIEKFVADHNVTLEVFEEELDLPRPRSMMPQWKRDFDRRVGGIVITTPPDG